MEEKEIKRGKGRPSRGIATRRVNMFIESELYEFIVSHKGGMTVTEYINNLIRKEAMK